MFDRNRRPPLLPTDGRGDPGYAPPAVHGAVVLQYVAGGLVSAFGAFAVYVAVMGAAGRYNDHQDPDDPYGEISINGEILVFGATAIGILLLGVAVIVLGRMLRRCRQWARITVVALSVLALAGLVATVVATGTINGWVALGAVYPVLSLTLLNAITTRSWFRDQTW